MEIPTPPADSLYKFKAISGIILMVAALYIGSREANEVLERWIIFLTARHVQTTTAEEMIATSIATRKRDAANMESIRQDLDRLESNVEQQGKRDHQTPQALGETRKKAAVIRAEIALLQHPPSMSQAQHDTMNDKLLTLEASLIGIRYATRVLFAVESFCVIAFLLGLGFTLRGFAQWNNKLQMPQDELLQITLEQARVALRKG